MIAEWGQWALSLALMLSLMLAVVPMAGALRSHSTWMALARPLAAGQFVFVLIAYGLLTACFLNDDFSVALVANHSNSLLPDFYKFSAVWGSHEGSMLLWVLILAGWLLAVAMFSQRLPLDFVARVLSVMGLIGSGFIAFTLFTSNPFDRLLPFSPADGQDLNPLLQDPGMIIHPPLLYFGYVGFSVAFAFAIAALSSGRLDTAWARWSRPWTNVAWTFLTLGIAVGSWWAYYELGWGGWWFWDPVENASFMPWLAGTALIHSLAVTEKRGVFKSWTVLLAITAFSLSLLGTFLVRSGVLTSVHSFASDPTRGLFILGFLALVVGGSLTLYALRAPAVAGRAGFALISREVMLLVNNILLVVATLTVLFGTLFPLIMDGLGLGKYSVGPPYFNAVFVPIMAILVVFMGLGPSARWKQTPASLLRQRLLVAAIASLLCGLLFASLYGAEFEPLASVTICLASWLLFSGVADLRDKLRNSASVWAGLRRLSRSYYGMQLAHLGLAVSIVGVGLTSLYSQEHDVRMTLGERHQLQELAFELVEVAAIKGPNYTGEEAHFRIWREDELLAELYPQKRRYLAQRGQVMTEAAVDAGLWRDIYVAMGEPLGQQAWAIRLHYKPFVRWIWLGALMMAAGGVLAALDKRYRLRSKTPVAAATVQSSLAAESR